MHHLEEKILPVLFDHLEVPSLLGGSEDTQLHDSARQIILSALQN